MENWFLVHFNVREGMVGEPKPGKLLVSAGSLQEAYKKVEAELKVSIFPFFDEPYLVIAGGYQQ